MTNLVVQCHLLSFVISVHLSHLLRAQDRMTVPRKVAELQVKAHDDPAHHIKIRHAFSALRATHYWILGTHHLSTYSANQVSLVIESLRPNCVALELCNERTSLLSPPVIEPIKDIKSAVRERPKGVGIADTILRQMKTNLAALCGLREGAYESAQRVKASVLLADMPQSVISRKVSLSLGFYLSVLFKRLVNTARSKGDGFGDYLNDQLRVHILLANAPDFYPLTPNKQKWLIEHIGDPIDAQDIANYEDIPEVLLLQRNHFMASNIRRVSHGSTVVCVVGKAHVDGLAAILEAPSPALSDSEEGERAFRDDIIDIMPARGPGIIGAKILLAFGVTYLMAKGSAKLLRAVTKRPAFFPFVLGAVFAPSYYGSRMLTRAYKETQQWAKDPSATEL